MNRIGLLIAGTLALVVGLTFGLYPELDLRIAKLFYDPVTQTFPLSQYPFLRAVRKIGELLPWFIGVSALVLLYRQKQSPRAYHFLLLTALLGPLLLVNTGLKPHWPRSGPSAVKQFGGKERFVAFWDWRGDCPNNCSFVSGEASGAFWTIAPAVVVAPPHLRPVMMGVAIGFGLTVGLLRMAFGGHFFSDVAFAGVFIFLIIWLCHFLLYRWRRD